jgi:hypothetical protein
MWTTSCSLKYLYPRKSPLWGDGVMVKNLTSQCEGEEFKSTHSQPRLPWLLR